ncbi:MAG TPA: UbiD family decarboxylase [Pirellulaceae bacterium]|nr:UbiD family decarboxylase [Pirellulaceae bacterium]HMO92378.1 UbiD family decarboxylase [Pirellulaceae bacterium]HMP70759.1 UbiD family decarboxylase [Pirellulaceae bacterium]
MGYRSTFQCVSDLERNGHLIRFDEPVDPHLQLAEIQRRLYINQAPAVLYTNVKGCRFPVVSNLFGTLERARFMFRDTIEQVRRAIELKIEPEQFFKRPLRYWKAPLTALRMRPKMTRGGAITQNTIKISDLPQQVSWPKDGGAFITLPQVFSEDARSPGLMKSNLGMYRIQLSGNKYARDIEIGLHYQIHRSIGVHHQAALAAGKPFRVNIFVGGSPAMTLSAVMPLPEGMSELTFAGALAGHRIPMWRNNGGLPIYADADFCICGTVDPQRQLPEGPFGDHLGYYSLVHEFPVLKVEKVLHRNQAIWPLTVVGRPPQEDTAFGDLIHELTGPIIPSVLPGVKAVHAVDAAGVHPLLIAIGSERYVPYRESTAPQELLTQANAILGQGQLSLAKFLWIIDEACDRELDIHDVGLFFQRVLERVDWSRDVHFQTRTTIDTLDYTGDGFNQGSKVVIAASGKLLRRLPDSLPSDLRLPDTFRHPRIAFPGVLLVEGPAYQSKAEGQRQIRDFAQAFDSSESINQFPLIVVLDDSDFASRNINNFCWTVFTRSNPASDIDGIAAKIVDKHWGCSGSLIIDARIKPHHAPPLVEDPQVTASVDAIAARGLPISKFL